MSLIQFLEPSNATFILQQHQADSFVAFLKTEDVKILHSEPSGSGWHVEVEDMDESTAKALIEKFQSLGSK